MIKSNNNKKGTNQVPFFRYVINYGLPLLGIALLLPYLIRLIKSIKNTSNEQTALSNNEAYNSQNAVNWIENQNPELAKNKLDTISKRLDIQSSSIAIADNLGTIYLNRPMFMGWEWTSILNYKTWTENENEVLRLVKFQRKNFSIVAKMYSQVLTKNRNLSIDLQTYLPKNMLKEIPYALTSSYKQLNNITE